MRPYLSTGAAGEPDLWAHHSLARRLFRPRQADQVRNDPKRPRYTGRQLAKPGIAGVHVLPFAVRGDEHPPALRRLSRIVGFQQRHEPRIPLLEKIQATLLDPAAEVLLRDEIRPSKDRVRGFEDRHRSRLIHDPGA